MPSITISHWLRVWGQGKDDLQRFPGAEYKSLGRGTTGLCAAVEKETCWTVTLGDSILKCKSNTVLLRE